MSAAVVFSDLFGESYDDLDGSVKNRVMDFVVKLQRDPSTPGLNLKQPAGVQDKRVRTARVNDFWRAVLIELPRSSGYILVAVKPHDDAYAYAQRLTFGVNEVTGALEIVNTHALATAVTNAAALSQPNVTRLLPATVRKSDLIRFGVQAGVAEQLLTITDEDALLDVAAALPRSQADAVLDLYAGLSPDEVWSSLDAADIGEIDTADVSTALSRPLSRLSFTDPAGEDSADELRAVLEGSLAKWRVWLHPMQRKLANHDGWNGPYRVTGGAGTGKTVTAVHRARHLARRLEVSPDLAGKVLVTTFTRNLAQAIETQLVQLAGPDILRRVEVLNIDAVARRTLLASDSRRAHVEASRPVADSDASVLDLWSTAASVAADTWEVGFLQDEWSQIVLGNQITTEAEYLAVSRSGRGQRLSRPQRAEVWRVLEQFAQLLRAQGMITFTQLVADAASALIAEPGLQRALGYAYAVIDEAQDLHPAHWRLLRAIVPAGKDDLFIVGDAHQRIYGRPIPLSRYGIETRGRSRRLTVNYRTSRQILRWCLGIVDVAVDDLDGETETLAGARSLFGGPHPATQGFPTAAAEDAALGQSVRAWIDEGLAPTEIAVFVREAWMAADVIAALAAAGVKATEVGARTDANKSAEAVQVMTMHRAKGLEFRAVALVRLGVSDFPPRFVRELAGDERVREERRERSLLYVAGSRARERLWVSWAGSPSALLG